MGHGFRKTLWHGVRKEKVKRCKRLEKKPESCQAFKEEDKKLVEGKKGAMKDAYQLAESRESLE